MWINFYFHQVQAMDQTQFVAAAQSQEWDRNLDTTQQQSQESETAKMASRIP
jgi:hypothetical protein